MKVGIVPLREHLRQATHPYHMRLHMHPLLSPLQGNTISMEQYYNCLRTFHQAYAYMEKRLSYRAEIQDVPTIEWLEKDMQIHGISPVLLNTTAYPFIDTESKYLGYLYVKQGSTLGGRIISKHLHEKLGLIEGTTNHFFAGFSSDTGTRWKSFLTSLNNARLNEEEVVNQAILTFAFIAECCDKMLGIQMEKR